MTTELIQLNRSQWTECATVANARTAAGINAMLESDPDSRPFLRASVDGWHELIDALGGATENETANDIHTQIYASWVE